MTSAAPLAVIKRFCHYCSGQFWPHEFIHLPRGHRCCLRCWEWHGKAMALLSQGTPPPGCQECSVTFNQLQERSLDGNTRMALVKKDGIYQVLCFRCSEKYIQKRRDLYGKTIFGHERGLT